MFGGRYEAYLAEREVRRRHAREAYDEFAETKSDLTARMRSQRAWAVQGVAKEKKNPKDGDKAQRSERFVGKFRRSISLPTRVDANKINASYKGGILTVTLPKAEEVKPKQIQVNVS